MRSFILAAAILAAATVSGCAGQYALDAGKVVTTIGEAGVSVQIEAVIRRVDQGGYSADQAKAELARLATLQRGLAIGRTAYDLATGGLLPAPDLAAARGALDDRLAEAASRLANVAEAR